MVENKKSLAEQLYEAGYNTYKEDPRETVPHWESSNGIDTDALLSDLREARNSRPSEERILTENPEYNVLSEIGDMGAHLLRQMNDAQIGEANGELVTDVLPNIDRIQNNLKLFEEFDNTNNQINQVRAALSVEQDDQTISELQNTYNDLLNKQAEQKKQLVSLGVAPNLSNAQDIISQQESELKNLQTRADKLYKSIETDEADKSRYDVSDEYLNASQASEFKWTEPSTWRYTLPGVIGSSAGSWMWQIAPYATSLIKNVAKKALAKAAVGAAAGSVVPVAGTAAGGVTGALIGVGSAAITAVDAGVMLYSNWKQSESETYSELFDGYKQKISEQLANAGITPAIVVALAKEAGISEQFSNLSDNEIFDKILNGQIPVQIPELNAALQEARRGLNQRYRTNQAITFGTDVMQDAIMLSSWGNKLKTGRKLLGTVLDPVGGVTDLAGDAAKKHLRKYVLGRNAVDKEARKWLSRGAKAGYVGADLGLRALANAVSEGAEEGGQYRNNKEYLAGAFNDKDDLNLQHVGEALLKAYEVKGKAAWDIVASPFGLTDPLYENDTEYWQNIKLGAAASLFSPLSVASNVMGINTTVKELQGMDKVNDLAAAEVNAKDNVEKAIIYSGDSYKGRESEVVNAWLTLANGPKENLPEGFTKEDILEEAQFASRVFNLKSNKSIQAVANALRIDTNSSEYGELLGIFMQSEDELKATNKSKNEAERELDTRVRNMANDPVFGTMFEAAVNSVVDEAKTVDKEVPQEAIASLLGLRREMDVIDNMLSDIEALSVMSKDDGLDSYYGGNVYTKTKLEDFKYRLRTRQKALQTAYNNAIKPYKESSNVVEQAVDKAARMTAVDEINELTEKAVFARMNAERAQEVYRSFLNAGPVTLTETLKSREIKQAAASTKKSKKRKKLKLKALRNIHDNQGIKLIEELFELYQTKKQESRELNEGVSGIVTPTTPAPVVDSSITISPLSEPTPSEEPQPINPTQPRPTSASSTSPITTEDEIDPWAGATTDVDSLLSEADAALAEAEVQPITEPPVVVPESTEIENTEESPVDVADDDPWQDTELRDSTPDAATPSSKSKKDKAKEEFDQAASELKDAFDDLLNLGFAYDPARDAEKQAKVFTAFLKFLGKAFNLGKYKFQEVALQFCEFLGGGKAKLEPYFNAFKGAYTTAYYSMPTEEQTKMTNPGDVAVITLDSLFDAAPESDLTEEELADALASGAVTYRKDELPSDAITDAQLAEFNENTDLGILNTFHYRHDSNVKGETLLFNGKAIEFAPNAELPDLLNNPNSNLTFEYSVAPFVEYKTGRSRIDWSNPATYDWARVGMIVTDENTGKHYWIAMRAPKQLLTSAEFEERRDLIQKLRKARQEIIEKFVIRDDNGNLTNRVTYKSKVKPSRILIHSAVSNTVRTFPMIDSRFSQAFKLESNLDEEIKNFAYSDGRNGTGSIYRLNGDNTGFSSTTYGGLYYIIDSSKTRSGRTLPIKVNTAKLNSVDGLANLLSRIIFESGFNNANKVEGTSLIGTDIINLFLNYGNPTTVSNQEQEQDSSILDNLKNKQLYIANSALHYGKNTVRISGLSAEQKEKERKAFEDWLNANINIAFKVPSEKNQIDVTMPLSKMFNGRLAESVNNAGGSLNLLGFNITNEDLNKSWLAFLLKNGLINSDLDAERYSRPYVIAEGIIKTAEPKTTVSPNTPEISKVEEQPKTEEKPEVKQRRTVRSVRANFSVPGKVNFTPNKKYESKKKLNSVNAKKFLREKLGLRDSEIDIIDVIISSEKPTTALSYMTKDAITLYSSDPLGTEYHEGYHRVSLLLLSDKQRNALYKEYREKNPFAKKLSDKEVEELMAEDFRAFALNKDAAQSSFIRRWYEKLKDFVNSLIGSKINKLYRGIYEGKYKNIPVNEESKRRFEEVYGGKANFTQHGHKYENIKSLDNYYQAVEYLANTYINKALDESQNSSDITKIDIDFEDMRDLLDDFSYDEELTSEQRAALKELHDNFDGVRQDVESYLQSLNLKKLQDEEEYESNEERDGGEIEKDNFDKYDRASYEVSILHSIRPAVKLFLSSIEEVQVSGNNATQDVNKETGLPVVTSFVSSWLRITSKLFGEETFEGLVARSAELAQRDDFFVSFYNRLINVRDTNLQTQILHTITGFKHNFLTVGFQEITDENDNISYAADLGGSVRQRYAKKVVSDWNKNFFESDLITVDASGNRTPNKPKLKKLLDSYNELVKQISKVNESTVTEEEISKILASYANLLNEIGINVTSDTLYQAIEAKAEVKNSVNHNSFFKTLKELLVNNSSGSLSRAIPDILKNPAKTGRINRTIDAVFSSEPSILNLAMVYYEMNRNTAEEKVLGPKNTAVYPMSKHNYLTLEIKKLNKDRNYVKDLMKCPINAASMILKALKKDSTLTLTPGTLLNITEYYSGSSGTDYQSAPRVETFISKLVLSENDILLLPTMSDKKTYMPIQGIRLFSGRTLEVTSESGSIKIRFSNDVLDQFAEYYRSEYEAIKQYYLIKSQEDKVRDENRPTRYFGTRGKDNGRGGKFRICKGLYIRNEEGQEEYVNFNKLLEEGSFQEVEDYFNNAVKLKEDINRTLLHNVDSTIDYAKKLGLISHNNGFLQNAKLPIGYVSKRADTLGANHLVLSGDANSKLRNHIAVFDLLSAFTVNQFVSMFEAEKILYKDSAFFKNYADVSKRLAGVLSTGTVPRTDFSDPNHIMNRVTRYKQGRYNVAGLKDIELRTNQPVELYNAIYKAYVREYLENETDYTKEKIDNIFETSDLFTSEEVPESIRNKARQNTERDLSLYGDVKMDENGKIVVNEDETPINQADASVYCSPQMYKAILASIGELTPEVEEAIDYLEQYADTGDLKDIRKYISTLAAVISPKKMIYFGNEILSPIAGQYINMPIFNKMAIFPLFKVLATGDIRHLYDRMNDPINPIDMFTTSSAVKVGNIVEYDFYTDSTQKEITDEFKKNSSGGYDKPITYRQQNFRNLLDQMPIAAHEAEKRMLVTQAMKTVFSNLRQDGDYFLPSLGKSVSGKELVKYAMDAINDLSDRGLNRLLKQFHAEKTTTGYKFKDLDGLSEKLVYSLISSNADTDILEQVSLNEDGEFNVPLSVSPLAKKLVSNFISAINKETVDINLPGGTFIQMSSFGLKREKLSQTEAETKGILINNGERLKLVNKDNSMDCVISINLLKHFIPDYENKTFAESRQWLIDNKIIGPEASPSAMAYRVPTQGMSSIAALSIRDVVMSQAGDIIILPDEFTARTGSDFDIDKLFLTRYNYSIKQSNSFDRIATEDEKNKALEGFNTWMDEVLSVKNGKAVTRRNTLRSSVEAINQYLSTKKSKVRYDVADGAYKVFVTTAEKTKYDFDKPMSENSQAAVENLLIDTFMASLLDSKNVHDTTRPLDVPVNIMKKDIVKKYFKDKVSDVALYEYTLEYQDNLKQDFADSKSGIGPFALNNPHHVLGQLVGLYMNMPEELSNLGNLHQVTGVDGIHILDWLSALISAHVDVAKDNYIIKLNVNSYTYNMTNFLIRSGMGKNSLMFVSQEIIKELANEYIQSKGVYGFDKGQPFYLRFRNKKEEIFERYVKKAMSLATKEQKVLLNTLIDPEFKVTDELLAEIPASGELTKLEQLLQTASENKKDFDYYFEQIRIFKLFEQITPYAEALSELVKASQVDTKKFGKNAIEMQNFLNKVDALYNSPFFDPEIIEKFFNNTFLLRKIENSIKFSLGLLGNVNIQAKPEYFKLFQNFVHAAGLSSLSNERSINELSNAIDSTVRAIALTHFTVHPNDAKHLFVGDNTIAKRLNKLKKDILEDAINGGNKYPNITVTNGRISNLLLNSLTGITDFSKKGIDYLRFDYSDDIASNASRQIREYWQELLESDNDEVSDFAYDLIQYAVYTGFGTKHINSLFDFIPTSFLESGYYDEIRRVEQQTGAVTELFDHDTIDELYRNNWFNDLLVPTVKVGGKNAKMFSYVSQGKNKQIALINPKGRRLVSDERGVGLYAPYVKARVRNASCGYNLYKFVGTFQKTNKLGKIEETPLYILVNKKGYREGGKGFVTEYFNYGMYGGHTSLIPNNNVSLKFKDASGNLQYLEDLPDVLDKFINNLINKTGNLGVYRKADTIQYMFQLDGSNGSNSMKFNEIETDDGEIVEDVNNTIAESDNMQQTNVDTTTLDELTKLGEQRKKECE